MNYPKHVAIIPDGNRTWAKENGKSIQEAYIISYQKGVQNIKYLFENTDAKVFTLRGLSTENANKRSKEELDLLMNLYKIIDTELDEFMLANSINFRWIGNPDGITEGFKNYLDEKVENTKCESDKFVIFAINYGGRDEIIRGLKKLNNEGFDFSNITENDISKSLELGDLPPIELVIRTKGNYAQRTSGFMSWWIGYAELYFTDKKCPEFDPEDLKIALAWFDTIGNFRNFGK